MLRVCVDVGSTYTKATLVDGDAITATATHRTTVEVDVLDGIEACRRDLADLDPRAADSEVLACSSAGGGLRIAVVATADGERLDPASEPDVVLLTGGTDGGNVEVLLTAARDLAAGEWHGPVVVAGNVEAHAEVAEVLAGLPHVLAGNVVPRIGVLEPTSARGAVREVFLAHVIGGKHLSASPAFAAMVRGATPDVVLRGVEVLAARVGDVVVVDVGGATTDVHSVVALDPEDAGLGREVVASTPVTRTVEGDLGMRWSAVATAEAAGRPDLREAARRRRASPGWLPGTPAERDDEEALAGAAASLAVRRHAGRSRVVLSPEGRVVERTGVDLRAVGLVVASGGVFRHARPGAVDTLLAGARGVHEGGWQLPEAPQVVVDDQHLLAAVGLLADVDPEAAGRLVRRWLGTARP